MYETKESECTKNEPTLIALYESCILSIVTKGRGEMTSEDLTKDEVSIKCGSNATTSELEWSISSAEESSDPLRTENGNPITCTLLTDAPVESDEVAPAPKDCLTCEGKESPHNALEALVFTMGDLN